jgi:hypothetical protein
MQAEADSLRAELVALFERDDHDGDEGDHDEGCSLRTQGADVHLIALRWAANTLPTHCPTSRHFGPKKRANRLSNFARVCFRIPPVHERQKSR